MQPPSDTYAPRVLVVDDELLIRWALGQALQDGGCVVAEAGDARTALNRTARVFLTANGLLLPFIALQMYFHPLIWIASLWAITFPGATWSLALIFRRPPHA